VGWPGPIDHLDTSLSDSFREVQIFVRVRGDAHGVGNDGANVDLRDVPSQAETGKVCRVVSQARGARQSSYGSRTFVEADPAKSFSFDEGDDGAQLLGA
jgi:hypothetical protein